MSGNETSEHLPTDVPDADIITVRKRFEVGGLVVGRRVEAGPDEEMTPEPRLEPSVDTDVMPAVSSARTQEGQPADSERLRTRAPSRFTIQRPVIYGNARVGFFENEGAQSLLEGMREQADFPVVPHVTIAQKALVKQIMARRQGTMISMIASECRQAVMELPERKFARITGAKTMGTSAVMLDMDWESRGRLGKDVRHLCEHFGIPFDDKKADYYPHVTVMWARDPRAAQRMADELTEYIQTVEPTPDSVTFGDPTVLVGRNGS